MKKEINFLIVIIVSSILFSCGKSDSPSTAAEKFLAAISKEDFDAAKAFGTDDTDRLLDMMSGYKKMGAQPFMSDAKFDVTGETVTGDNATVAVKVEGKNKEMLLNLQKENGKWKVAMNKETINESETNIFNIGATNTDTTSTN